MCHADGSIPPESPRGGAFDSAQDLHLTSADGTPFMAYHARTSRAGAPAVVILPDFRGLHDFYRRLADKLAAAGIDALAIDYFGRTLPDGPRTGDPAEMVPMVLGLPPELVAADIHAATAELRGNGAEQVFSLGFCFGGSQSWLQSASPDGLTGCIGFYGRPEECRAQLPLMRSPLLLLVAGADALTPVEDFQRFDQELSAADVEHTMVIYPQAPHSFFDGAAGHDEACADAWQRLLDFVDSNCAAGITA